MIAPIQIIEERTVGPSLGQENIDLGTKAIVYGFIAVLIFMLIYYKKFGLVANIALTLNLVMIIGIMSLVPGASLTLPGMAGIVLTVGMAVDANVLIFERIREEIKLNPPKIFISGHSHILKVQFDKKLNLLHLNPGAAGKHGFHQVRTMLRFKIDVSDIKEMEIIELEKRG